MACSELMELNLNELEQAAGGDPLPRRRSVIVSFGRNLPRNVDRQRRGVYK